MSAAKLSFELDNDDQVESSGDQSRRRTGFEPVTSAKVTRRRQSSKLQRREVRDSRVSP